MGVKVLQIHKRGAYNYKYIQDKFSVDLRNSCFSIADGTTQSFSSEIWAEMLASNFTKNPVFEPSELIHLLQREAERFKSLVFEYSSNPAIASIQRSKQQKGATSTLLGISIEGTMMSVIGCGDCVLFHINKDELTFKSYPFSTLDELDGNKKFLNSESLLHQEVDADSFWTKKIEIRSDDIIVLGTDAISRLIIKDPKILDDLLQVSTFDDLYAFCLGNWKAKLLEEDDITLLIMDMKKQAGIVEIIPAKYFEFEKEEEVEFLPTIQTINEVSDSEMIEMNNQVNALGEQVYLMKTQLKDYKTLLVIFMSLCAINSLLLLFFYFGQNMFDVKLSTSSMKLPASHRKKVIPTRMREHTVEVNGRFKKAIESEDSVKRSTPVKL